MNLYGYKNSYMTFFIFAEIFEWPGAITGIHKWILYVYQDFFRNSCSITGIFIWICTIAEIHIRFRMTFCSITGVFVWPSKISGNSVWPCTISGFFIWHWTITEIYTWPCTNNWIRTLFDHRYSYMTFSTITEIFKRLYMTTGIHI